MMDRLIRGYYACFNDRRFTDAADLFADDASVERPPFAYLSRGRDAYLDFAGRWLQAFPDARLTIQHIEQRAETVCEVELMAAGTHLNALDLGPLGVFKPTDTRTTLHMRELLDIQTGKIAHSSLSFDLHDLVRQLVAIDYAALDVRLGTIEWLREELGRSHGDRDRRAELTERLGRELDAARLIIRPWFRR